MQKIEEIVKLSDEHPELVGEITRVLVFTYIHSKIVSIRKVMHINPHTILSYLWEYRRYMRVCEGDVVKITEKNPPYAIGYETKYGIIYTLIDGNHRVECAKDRNVKEIAVFVECISKIPDYKILLEGNYLIVKSNAYRVDPKIARLVLGLLQ